MPPHYPGFSNEQQVWDLVNFVLALPYEPGCSRSEACLGHPGPGRRRPLAPGRLAP